ncbi:MAG: DUF411 domain-containing protein [Xanthomonadales bacterium]|nr:DUF411 domain-containing protein [Xanthomonadales bacterium]
MKTRLARPALWLAPLVFSLAACAQEASTPAPAGDAATSLSAAPSPAPDPATPAAELPLMVVHKTPWCGCCELWMEHMKAAGFQIQAHDMDDLAPVKQRLGVPHAKGSCHTTEIGGYLVEGHVPAEDIKRLLAEQPDALGLVLPGMPLGSPGMAAPDGRTQPFTVELVRRDGSTEPYSHH